MKQKRRLIFLVAVLAFLIPAYFLFFFHLKEGRYNKIMCYYITRSLTDGLESFDDKITAIRDFVHENVLPIHGYHNRLDTAAIEKSTSGIGWCDQSSRVFMQLARSLGITTRLLFLRLESGSSPHSIAEALAPDGRWIIVDPAYKLDLINRDGNFATQSDIKKDLSIIRDNKRVKLRAKIETRWADPSYLSIYANTPTYVVTTEGTKFDFLKFMPMSLLRPIVNIINNKYLNQIKPDMTNIYEFKMKKARTWHLLGYYIKSRKLYDEIIADSGDLSLIRKANFYKAVLLKDRKKYNEAYNHITAVIKKDKDNPYIQYLLGLRSRILKEMDKPGESEKDLIRIGYSLQA